MQRLQNTTVFSESATFTQTRPLSPEEKRVFSQDMALPHLQPNDISSLTWFDYPGLTRIGAPVGYSMLHSLFATFYKPYMTGFIGDMPLDQRGFIASSFPVFGDNPEKYPERLGFNIFIFDYDSKSVSLLGDSFQTERTSVLLHKSRNNYSTLALNVASSGDYPTLKTTFESDHELIQRLRVE
ncbi:hypothetical protein BQ9231_00636 [Cedratvirus lausannensis]|uniref:Uncharacterized protein n=1 Tax=Cedratvirus lausannensis TaxID=2023205 RepID=A0A285PY27_9VIRU|nr:hypothetical protein BQ9231_00636 [Cedratvirus lausannensis]